MKVALISNSFRFLINLEEDNKLYMIDNVFLSKTMIKDEVLQFLLVSENTRYFEFLILTSKGELKKLTVYVKKENKVLQILSSDINLNSVETKISLIWFEESGDILFLYSNTNNELFYNEDFKLKFVSEIPLTLRKIDTENIPIKNILSKNGVVLILSDLGNVYSLGYEGFSIFNKVYKNQVESKVKFSKFDEIYEFNDLLLKNVFQITSLSNIDKIVFNHKNLENDNFLIHFIEFNDPKTDFRSIKTWEVNLFQQKKEEKQQLFESLSFVKDIPVLFENTIITHNILLSQGKEFLMNLIQLENMNYTFKDTNNFLDSVDGFALYKDKNVYLYNLDENTDKFKTMLLEESTKSNVLTLTL